MVGIGLFTVPVAFRISLTLFLQWLDCFPNFIVSQPELARHRFIEEIQFFRGDRTMIFVGLSISVIAVVSYGLGGFFTDVALVPLLYLYSLLGVSAFIAGVGLCAIFLGARALFKAGTEVSIRVESNKFGVASTGMMMIRIFFCIAVAWSFYVLSACTRGSQIVLGDPELTPPMVALALPTLAFFVLAFFISMFPWHRKMMEFKRQRYLEVTDLLEATRPTRKESLDSETISKIEFLEKQRDGIRKLPEWPFFRGTLMGVVISAATSIWPVLVNTVATVWAEDVVAGIVG